MGKHPARARALRGLVAVNVAQGKFSKAQRLYSEVLGIIESVYGKNHAEVYVVLQGYAGLLRKVHRAREAELIAQRIKAMRNPSDNPTR